MKTNFLKLATVTLLPAVLFLGASCSTPNEAGQATLTQSADGVTLVETVSAAGTVTAINPATRTVSLKMADGQRLTTKCGPQVVNFGQLKVGDQVKAAVTEELAVFLGKGTPPGATAGAAVALAPVGAKPGGMVANTMMITARVGTIDLRTRKVTLTMPDGSTKTITAGKRINLSGVKPGDDVTVQYTESLAVSVEKP